MIGVKIDSKDLGWLQRNIARFSRRFKNRALNKLAEKEAELARHRITTTKRDPDGNRWKPWSTHYAATKPSGTMLYQSGDLLRSIGAHKNVTFANVSYAGPVQAARPFLGGESKELDDVLNEEIQNHLDSVGL